MQGLKRRGREQKKENRRLTKFRIRED